MDRRTRTGLRILEAALLLGVLGDALLRATPWGLNVLLWAGALLAGFWALSAGRRAAGLAGEGRWLIAAALAAAAAFAWRDSPTLKLLDALALAVALSLLAWRARGRSVRLARFFDYARAVGDAALNTLFAALPLATSDVRWQTIPRAGFMRHAAAVARGLLIAVPLLAVFGALFMAADAVFEGLVRDNLYVDAGSAVSHALLAAALAWCVAGFFRGALLADARVPESPAQARPNKDAPHFAENDAPAYTSVTDDEKQRDTRGEIRDATFKSVTEDSEPPESASQTGARPNATDGGAAQAKSDPAAATAASNGVPAAADHGNADSARGAASGGAAGTAGAAAGGAGAGVAASPAARRFALGAVEVGTVLGLLDVLFASFVLVQIRYFFGGAAHVVGTTGLTYAEYARRGFFELVWVAALVLPLLLVAHGLLRRDAATVRLFRALAGAQLALLFVIMASAVARMRLYQGEYGLTELRLYTTAFMLWLGLVFVWFAGVVLWRERRERFACGALVSAALVLGALHLLDPDAHIVRANAALIRRGHAFDAAYASALSADAVPEVVAALPALSRDARCALASDLLARWTPHGRADWRTWNVSRARARKLVGAQQSGLRAEADCPAPAQNDQTLTQSREPAASTHAPAATPPQVALTDSAVSATLNAAMPATTADTRPAAGEAATHARTTTSQTTAITTPDAAQKNRSAVIGAAPNPALRVRRDAAVSRTTTKKRKRVSSGNAGRSNRE